MMKKCIYCESTNNLSVEHIIPENLYVDIPNKKNRMKNVIDYACYNCQTAKSRYDDALKNVFAYGDHNIAKLKNGLLEQREKAIENDKSKLISLENLKNDQLWSASHNSSYNKFVHNTGCDISTSDIKLIKGSLLYGSNLYGFNMTKMQKKELMKLEKLMKYIIVGLYFKHTGKRLQYSKFQFQFKFNTIYFNDSFTVHINQLHLFLDFFRKFSKIVINTDCNGILEISYLQCSDEKDVTVWSFKFYDTYVFVMVIPNRLKKIK
jgi:hypothetical protein